MQLATLRTQAFEHIIDAVNLEVPWQRHHRRGDAAQAEGTLATLAVEMGVHVVEVLTLLAAVAVGVAHGILERTCAVVYGMDEVMGKKQGNAAVNRGFIHCVKLVFKALQRECVIATGHRFENEDAHRGGFNVALLKHVNDMLVLFHCHQPCQPPD